MSMPWLNPPSPRRHAAKHEKYPVPDPMLRNDMPGSNSRCSSTVTYMWGALMCT